MKQFIYILITGCLLAFGSCKKLDLAPTDRFSDLTFWQSDANVQNALNNIYHGIYTSQYYFYNEALSDNAVTRLGAGAGNTDAIASGNYTPDLGRFKDEWGFYYGGIKSCNMFLENVDKNTTLSQDMKERMKAEVRFIRAWHHFRLTNWWGDVPLLTKDPSIDEAKKAVRASHADVIKFVLSELDAAAAVLPSKDQYAQSDLGRITKGAALALKARVLLYEGNRMQEVVDVCEQLMNNQGQNGTYSLASDYGSLFSDKTLNKINPETIFDLQYVPNLHTWSEYFDFAPLSAGSRTNNMAPTQELVNDYVMLNGKGIGEAGSGYNENDPYNNRDPRLTATIVYDQYKWQNPNGTTQTIYIKPGSDPGDKLNEYKLSGQGTTTGYYWRKYFDPNAAAGMTSGLNLILIRYAEVLLMYAEAKQALGQFDATVWDKTIRPLRERAGFTDPQALNFPSGSDLTEVIRRERRTEFAMEGLRIDDIRRWKIADKVLNGWAHGARFGDPTIDNGYLRAQLRQFDPNKNYLWPVPSSEVALDPNLGQNPGY